MIKESKTDGVIKHSINGIVSGWVQNVLIQVGGSLATEVRDEETTVDQLAGESWLLDDHISKLSIHCSTSILEHEISLSIGT
jgi:hypothetical protein